MGRPSVRFDFGKHVWEVDGLAAYAIAVIVFLALVSGIETVLGAAERLFGVVF